MIYEAKNTLKKHRDGWQFEGQVSDGQTSIQVAGVVYDYKTDGQLKRAIIARMKEAWREHAKKKEPDTKVLSADNIFKDKLSAVLEL